MCRLEQLPDSIGNATRLVKLQASFNQLQALPASLGKLPKLELMRVAANCIAEVAHAQHACVLSPLQYAWFKNLSEWHAHSAVGHALLAWTAFATISAQANAVQSRQGCRLAKARYPGGSEACYGRQHTACITQHFICTPITQLF